MSVGRDHRMHRVRTRRAGATDWHTTRFFVMGAYASRYAAKMRARGYEVQLAVAALGPWQVLP